MAPTPTGVGGEVAVARALGARGRPRRRQKGAEGGQAVAISGEMVAVPPARTATVVMGVADGATVAGGEVAVGAVGRPGAGARAPPATTEIVEGVALVRRTHEVARVEAAADKITARLPRRGRNATGEMGVAADAEAEVRPAPEVSAGVGGATDGRMGRRQIGAVAPRLTRDNTARTAVATRRLSAHARKTRAVAPREA